MSRRTFVGAAGALGAVGMLGALQQLAAAAEALAQDEGYGRGVLNADVRRTMEGFADTIVPGPAGGADPDPGAIEAGVVDEIYDDFYGASGLFPVIHADLQTQTPLILGRPASFDLDLSYADRERVLVARMEPRTKGGGNTLYVAYTALGALVWVAYYGVAASNKPVRYIGLPPHSDGYWPGHSYGIRFRGMTRHGYPR